jgi:hypothetical protein
VDEPQAAVHRHVHQQPRQPPVPAAAAAGGGAVALARRRLGASPLAPGWSRRCRSAWRAGSLL